MQPKSSVHLARNTIKYFISPWQKRLIRLLLIIIKELSSKYLILNYIHYYTRTHNKRVGNNIFLFANNIFFFYKSTN